MLARQQVMVVLGDHSVVVWDCGSSVALDADGRVDFPEDSVPVSAVACNAAGNTLVLGVQV